MEVEYGRPVEEIFVDITPEPLAAASLGQVRFCVYQVYEITFMFHVIFYRHFYFLAQFVGGFIPSAAF